jgi:hypothetical protein
VDDAHLVKIWRLFVLARSSKLGQKFGVNISTPILVPSFSSKGFKFDKEGKSEITKIIGVASEWLTESMLISAFDIHYGYIPKEFNAITELTFIDSGGYEKSDDYDLSTVSITPPLIQEWNEALLRDLYNSLPSEFPYVLVNYDYKRPILEQIENAREFFISYPQRLHTILLKREAEEDQYINIKSVLRYVSELSYFDIIGLTEKELGNSLLNRMYNIARIRQELDRNGISSPIHIFGSLDPVTSPLYFLAGAEIFDGLTWLRYSYLNGIAVYQHNYGALQTGISIRDDTAKAKSFVENINYLQDLKYQMGAYLLAGDFNKFKFNADFLKNSYDALCTSLGGLV